MKRYLYTFALILAMCALLCPFAAAEEPAQLRIELDRTEGYGGDLVTLSLYLTAENLGGLQTTIQWNGGYLSYVEGSAAFDAAFTQNAQMSMINDDLENGIRLVYGNTAGYSAADALIFTAQFQLSSGVNGATTFAFSDTKLTNASVDLAQLAVETSGAAVTTSIYSAGDAYLRLSRDVAQPYIGDTITVSMHVSSTGDPIGSLQGTITYDTSIFEYVEGSAAFSEAGQASAFTQIINADTDGQLNFVYGSLTGCPEGDLLSMQLKVIGGQNGYRYIQLQDAKASNVSADHLTMMTCHTTNAYVYPQLRPEVLYYTLKQDAATVSHGDTVTLNLSAEGVAFGGLQVTLNYNAEQLEYVDGSAAFTSDFASSAAISMVNDSAAGVIKLIYSNVGGYTPIGEDIFTAQFVVKDCIEVDPVTLTDIKTTNTSADDLHEMESVFVQGISWEDVLTGHSEVIAPAVAPACTASGLTEGTHCEHCGEVFIAQQDIPATGHAIAFEQNLYEVEMDGETLEIRVLAACGHDVPLSISSTQELDLVSSEAMSGKFTGEACGVATVTAATEDPFKTLASCKVIIHAAERLILPEALTAIQKEAFIGLNIQEVVLSDAVAFIGAKAFAGCSGMALINLPDDVQIAEDAFSGCDLLTIICSEGSPGQAFAEANHMPYVIR